MRNSDIKNEMIQAGVKFWQVAEQLGICDGNFSRRLRKELPESEKAKIRKIIRQLKAEGV